MQVRYRCAACRAQPQPKGATPVCAFETGVFCSDGWLCGTMEELRALVYEGRTQLPPGVSYRYCEDQKYATVHIDDVLCKGKPIGLMLWISWYKSRGTTDAVWVLDSKGAPRPPTEQEVLAVLSHYREANSPSA